MINSNLHSLLALAMLILPAQLVSAEVELRATASTGSTNRAEAALDSEGMLGLAELTAKMDNPFSDLWFVFMQNDTTIINGDLLDLYDEENLVVNSFKFQPVMPISLSEKWNLITRPVLMVNSVPLKKSVGDLVGKSFDQIAQDPDLIATLQDPWGRTTGLGDMALLTLLGPSGDIPPPGPGNTLVWGAGATQLFPTASETVLGMGKWQAGPALMIANLSNQPRNGFNYGILAQHWWSYAGDSDRNNTSMTDIQYFVSYKLTEVSMIGMAPNIKIDWQADSDNRYTVPVGLGYTTMVRLGRLPVRLAVEVQYNVIRPDSIGGDWNFRLVIAPIIPGLF